MTAPTYKSGSRVRSEAIELARTAAQEREATGDPEGAQAFRDLVRQLRAIRIVEDDAGEAQV